MGLMADFETAYYLTNKVEGGYVNDPDDKGGETYRGIARKFHPDWDGWIIFDKEKESSSSSLSSRLDGNPVLQAKIQKFYLNEYWNKVNGDLIPEQRIANEVYDNAVNMGYKQSSEYLQRTINILNRNQKEDFYKDIKVDGNIGPGTIEALKQCLKLNGAKRVLNVINGFQFKHYLELMEKNPVNEKYIGWFDRVEVIWN